MSKSKPLSTSARQVPSPTKATPAPSTSALPTGYSEAKKSIPTLKSKSKKPDVMAEGESDGYALKDHPGFKDAPSDDDEVKASMQDWEAKFAVKEREYEARSAKRRAREDAKKVYFGVPMQESVPVLVAGSGNSSATKNTTQKKSGSSSSSALDEPRLRARERSSTFRETLRGGLQRMTRASMTTADFEVASLGDLVNGRWISGKPVKRDAEDFPLLDTIPPSIRKALLAEYLSFTQRGKSKQLGPDETELELKKIIAKRFLSMTVFSYDSDFDQSKIGSMMAINRYLSKNFDFKIEPPGSAESAESETPKSPKPESDVVDLLVLDAVSHSRNYRADWSVDLGEAIKTDLHAKTAFADTIEAAMKGENVTKVKGQRSDVSATLVRDFPHSVYQMETADGSIKTINSIDEFVSFVGDPQKTGMPLQVSHFACQNLGIFIENLMFSKTDSAGTPQSVLKLFDGTPVAITTSPSASYLLKKTADGSIEIQYHSRVDTKGAQAAGKNTARVWVDSGGTSNWKPVVIENAFADVDCSILVHPDATVTLGLLSFKAEGWNHVD